MRALRFFFMESFNFKFAVFLFMVLFLELFLIHCVAARCLEAENSALLQLKKGFTSEKLESWLPGTDCCIWEHVACDKSGRITGLYLGYRSIAGTINPSLFNLTTLDTLDLSGNNFDGIPIPDSGWDRLVNLSRLDLSFAGFVGKVPASFSHLTKLTHLDLSSDLYQSLAINPRVLQNMNNLKELSLDGANVSKYQELCGVLANSTPVLEKLSLARCSLFGTICSSIFNLTSLDTLNFAYNNFDRIPIPDSGWERLVNLSSLELSHAGFVGKVPASFSHLTKLTFLHLSSDLNLSISPTVLHNMSNLKSLVLDNVNVLTYRDEWCRVLVNSTPVLEKLNMNNCSLFGAICSSLPMLPFLSVISLEDNNLDSSIPDSFANFSSLSVLNLGGNKFKGFFPNQIFQLRNLKNVDISYNLMLSGYLPDFPKYSNLRILLISYTNFSGNLPDSIGNIKFLYYLDLSNNKFHGAIPHGICANYNYLQVINLRHNKLEGLLPRSLSNCGSLVLLDLAYNNLKDTFPYWLGNRSLLSILVLRSNKFYGLVGPPDGSHDTNYAFPMMHVFDISSNNFSGYLSAKCFSSLKSMMINKVEGQIDLHNHLGSGFNLYELLIMNKGRLMTLQYYALSVKTIDFSNNHFEGEIPSAIGQLVSLQVLNMSHNYLTGEIPHELGNLVWLESLDLSRNNLSGKIPQEFVSLHSLSYLNLSYNKLVGTVPQGAQLCTFPNTSFEGNEGLHWFSCSTSILATNNTTTSPSSLGGKSPNNKSYMIVLGLLFGVGFGGSMAAVVLLDVMFCNKDRWRSRIPSHG